MGIEKPDIKNMDIYCNCTAQVPIKMTVIDHNSWTGAKYQCSACGRKKIVDWNSWTGLKIRDI